MSAIIPVILSGGVGSRLWPLSRKSRPKQLLPLAGPNTMIQETLARAQGEGFAAPIVICSADQRFLVAEQLRQMGSDDAAIIVEPLGRNTAPAAAIAALHAMRQNPDALLLLMPSDHVVADIAAFAQAVAVAAEAGRAGALVTFGIAPNFPETGYGYIKSGAAMVEAPGALMVERFVEKPDRATAQAYLEAGGYYWNGGIFLFRAGALLDEMARSAPDILEQCRHVAAGMRREGDFYYLDAALFGACPARSLDFAVMEHARKVAVVPVEMGWNDIGSWQALWEIAAKNSEGNAVEGDVLLQDAKNSYIRSEGPLVAAIGVEDLVIVATPDAVLVSHRGAVQDVKKIVDELERQQRHHHLRHPGDKSAD